MNIRKHYLVFLAFSLVAYATSAQNYSSARVQVSGEDFANLGSMGIAIDHIHQGVGFIEGDFSTYELELIRSAGFTFEILAADAELAYQKKPAHKNANHERNNEDCIASLRDFGISSPNHFGLGTYQGNYTYKEMLAELDKMASRYPDLISTRTNIGTYRTYEGRPIEWVRISDNPNVDEEEPEILYTALHHAREPVSLSQLIYFMWYLLENSESDESIHYLVHNTELYFIPCVNPDGYVYNETQHPGGGGLWRKNRRANPDGSFGVDLNRNYGHKWGLDNDGSSNDMKSEVYRGHSAFSEPETQAVRDLVLAHDFKVALNYHSYGGFLIYPWGYTSQPAEDIEIFKELGLLLTKKNRYIYGTGLETVSYTTNGDADDWMYGEQETKPRIFSMTPEIGTKEHGFWPNAGDVEYLCQAAFHQNLQAASFLLSSGMVIDESESFLTEKSGLLPMRITKLGFEDVGLSLSFKPITNNIQFDTPPRLYILSLFSKQRDNFAYSLSSNIQDGERIRFSYTLDNGTYSRTDTIVKYYREPRFALNNQGTPDDWEIGGLLAKWGTSEKFYYSAPSSLTDSPNGNYVPYSTNYLTLKNPIFLGGRDSAVLTFKALWDIQYRFDFMKMEISSDGGSNYLPLCGHYSTAAIPNTAFGDPVYTGRQLDWVSEKVDLSDYLGQEVMLRFAMISTSNDTRDGIYIDDIKVLQYNEGSLTSSEFIDAESFASNIAPNPADNLLNIHTKSDQVHMERLYIYNHLGQMIETRPFQEFIQIDVSSWPAGFYFYHYVDRSNRKSKAKKIVIN